ncbi:MAG: tetratricopeptide repeat protein [Candidatus Omnitrophica bacterium]|nr:tetratricopeptide repeat protein [Candidatus Omnitrophota bacterium]
MLASARHFGTANAINTRKSAAVNPVREVFSLTVCSVDGFKLLPILYGIGRGVKSVILSNGVKQKVLLPFLILFISCLFAVNLFAANEKSIKELYGDYLKGLFYAEDGDYASSLNALYKVKKLDPQSVYVRLKIASVLIRMGELEKAETELKEAKVLDPESFDASLGLIFLYSYSQKDRELETEYEDFLKKAHRLKPEDIKISEYLAQFYFYKKQPQEALGIYEDIVKHQPDYVDALFWLGFLYDEVGRKEDAVKTWKKALQISPDNAQTLNSLGYLYAEQGKNLEEAESMIKKALTAEPENGAYLDSLGWVYFKKKNYKKAEECLNKAISNQEDPVIYEHLGDLYLTLNKKDKAIGFYRKGLERFPDNKELKAKTENYGNENKTSKK